MSKTELSARQIEAIKKTITLNNDKRLARIETYNLNPTSCHNCGQVFAYDRRHNKYCNQSCAASINNRMVVRNRSGKPVVYKNCLNCGCLTKNKKYCSTYCDVSHREKQRLEQFNNGELNG